MKKNIVLLFIISLFTIFNVRISYITNNKINDEKIVFEGLKINALSTEKEINDDLKKADNVQVTVVADYETKRFIELANEDSTREEIDIIKQRKREEGKSYYSKMNNEILAKTSISDYKTKYVSEYSPFIEYSFDKNTYAKNSTKILEELISNNSISKVYIKSDEKEYKVNYLDSLEYAEADSYVEAGEYTGEGVKVAVLDPGIIDEDHSSMSTVDYEIRDEFFFFETETDHATQMASIIANGIAPGCKIYSVQASGGLTGEFDWIVSKNVDIVNMSFGEETPSGEYGSNSATADFYAYTYGIIMVAAVGNNENNSNVGNPALGYNVISVGNNNFSNTLSPYSSYTESVGPEKPTTLLLGDSVSIPGFSTFTFGTSNSCAVLSGLIALMLEEYPEMNGNVELVMSTVVGCSRQNQYFNTIVTNGFNDESGAGAFKFSRLTKTIKTTVTNTNQTGSNNPITLETVDFRVNAGDQICVAISWIAKSTGSTSGISFTDYDVSLYGPTTGCIARGNSTSNNVEYINIQSAPATGNYYVNVLFYGNRVSTSTETIYLTIGRDVVRVAP